MSDTRLHLVIMDEDRSLLEAEDLAIHLLRELHELDGVEAARISKSSTPPGAKSGAAVEAAELLVTLISSGSLTALVELMTSWLGRNQGVTVALEVDGDKIEVTGASRAQTQQLIDSWLAARMSEE
ncbi:effector-associated constant component EACC1 [Motilibacter aurantiacus]|uniref:effector-associated constant component EACC1 n=1 Tax=Motilibacter aurantiacus TaxID=2714955 RepID=UPI00140876C6|nr:hypothetical protein [Motilibacter aurantiacus]NHC47140.1 hypothetical protein [Motilibacter aurantiacus]